jgi:2-polyprenyl-3-methyl-5-hydroxy-6-metoxy-1,4-benzoquinol methylase
MTYDQSYTQRLVAKQFARWKRILDVQAPYRWHLRQLRLGKTLDVGCGIGRCLAFLDDGVGIDINQSAIEVAQSRGLTALTTDVFETSALNRPDVYDSLLFAHVAEHVGAEQSIAILRGYLHLLRTQGRLVLITPQEAGYRSDPTHTQFIDFARQKRIIEELGLIIDRQYSFPFPKIVGRLFLYNEFVTIAHKA